MHFYNPVAQSVQNEALHDRMIAVEGVPDTREVTVTPAVLLQHVVDTIVQTLEGQGGASRISLGGMIEDHVEDDLNAGAVELAYHLLELANRRHWVGALRVGSFRRKEPHWIVAPVVLQGFTGNRIGARNLVLIEFVEGKELQRRNTELPEVGNALDHSTVGAGILRFSARMHGEPTKVRLVDHRFSQRALQETIAVPVERVIHDNALGNEVDVALPRRRRSIRSPSRVVAERVAGETRTTTVRLGVGIQEVELGGVAVAQFRLEWAINPVQVMLPRLGVRHLDMPDVSRAVPFRIEDDLLPRLRSSG